MAILERVREFIVQHSPNPVCDDCIMDHLDLSVRQHANHNTRELAQAVGFDRRVQTCVLCKKDKKAIRRG